MPLPSPLPSFASKHGYGSAATTFLPRRGGKRLALTLPTTAGLGAALASPR